MGIANGFVSAVLRSPLHRPLSGSIDLVRYQGRRSGREITTPTQYARTGDDVVILVARPETKTWWRNFRSDRDVEVLMQGRWTPMTARVVVGADEPDMVAPLVQCYLARFPRAARSLGGATVAERERAAVLVWCRPR